MEVGTVVELQAVKLNRATISSNNRRKNAAGID